MTARLVTEREVIARLLGARDVALLRRWRFGLRILGVTRATFSGGLAHMFAAVVTLADRGDLPTVEAVVSRGRVDGDDVAWIELAYQTETPLHALAVRLVDQDRRSAGEAIASTLMAAARD